jgi:hypothetical protein
MKSNPRPAATDLRAAIKAAYKDLRAKGYFCRSNFWCCSTCALAAIPEGRGDKFVFYHRQDDRDIDKSGSCMLAWAGDGDEIASAMERAGLKVEWNGSERTRILVAIE